MWKVLINTIFVTCFTNMVNAHSNTTVPTSSSMASLYECNKHSSNMTCNMSDFSNNSNKSMTLIVKNDNCNRNRTIWYCNTI